MAKRAGDTRSWSLVIGVGVVSLIVGYLIGVSGRDRAEAPVEQVVKRAETPAAPRTVRESVPPTPAATPPPQPVEAEPVVKEPHVVVAPVPRGDGARVAVVIDDLGRRVDDVVQLDELGVPITYSVLPFESRTAEVLREIERLRGEVLLHLPMQPLTEADPGPGALTRGMDAAELDAATRWALGAVGGARGVNNHMGSELSADSTKMRAILGVVGEHGLFFLDSRTSPKSVGYSLALEMGLAAAERQVFLDSDSRSEAIRGQFRRLLEVAAERGSAIAIGHPYRETLAVLREEVPRALEAGFEFVPVSALTHRRTAVRAEGDQSERKTSTGLD